MMYSAQVSMGDDYDPEEEETAFEKWVGEHLGKKAEDILLAAAAVVGGLFADLVHRYAGIVTLVVLGYIGAKMLFDGLRGESGDGAVGMLTWRVLLFQAIATSIDAFAVGVSLLAMDVRVVPACATIAVTTFLCSLLALFLGRRFGTALGDKAKAAGGLILLAIAIKAIL